MSKDIVITYDFHPPTGTDTNGLSTSKTHIFPVTPEGTGPSHYYDALRQTVLKAKATLGEELTAWKDAVGTKELTKEHRKLKTEDDQDEEDDANE